MLDFALSQFTADWPLAETRLLSELSRRGIHSEWKTGIRQLPYDLICIKIESEIITELQSVSFRFYFNCIFKTHQFRKLAAVPVRPL